MRKILLISFIVCTCCSIMKGQDEKLVVFVDYFSYGEDVTPTMAEALRSKVFQGLQKVNRVQLIDVASQTQLNSEEERRKAESAMGDATARTSQMQTLGANYIIVGHIISMSTAKRVDEKTSKVSYKGAVQWSIKVIDASTGTLLKTQTYKHDGLTGSSGDTPESAIGSTCDYAKLDMEELIEEIFPLKGTILKIETLSKKGDKAQTVVIDLGKAHGIVKGQRFNVMLEADIAGELALKEIGSLNAKEVLSDKRAICSVSKGDAEILKAMNAEQKLVVISRKNKLLEF